jgi:hypothetical protein
VTVTVTVLAPLEAAVRIEHRIQQASHRRSHPVG